MENVIGQEYLMQAKTLMSQENTPRPSHFGKKQKAATAPTSESSCGGFD